MNLKKFSKVKLSASVLYAFLMIFILTGTHIGKYSNILPALLLVLIITERLFKTVFFIQKKGTGSKANDLTIYPAMAVYILMAVGITIERIYLQTMIYMPAVLLGGLLYLLSLFLRWWAIDSLGKTWSYAISSVEGAKEKLVTTGAYSYLRHPMVLSVIIEAIAIPLIFSAFVSLVFSVVIAIPVHLTRLMLEEKKLLQNHQKEYTIYKKRCWAFVPAKDYFKRFSKWLWRAAEP